MAKLTQKRETFARLYVEYGDASKAFREAFPASQKWKDNVVWVKASELLKDGKVSVRIEELKKNRAQKLDISENRVLAEIAAIAFQDIGEIEGEHGGFAGLKSLKPATRRAIQSVKFKRYLERTPEGGFEEVEITEIKMHPKLPALERICEIKGITAPKGTDKPVNVTVNVTGNADVHAQH
jgi:translation elongation factor EF-G